MRHKGKLGLLLVLLATCLGIAWKGGLDTPYYHRAAQLVGANQPEAIFVEGATSGNIFYGPFFFVLLKPLAGLTLPQFANFLIVLNVLAFIALWVGISRLYPALWKGTPFYLWLLVWIVSIKPIHASFQCLNFQLVLMALFSLAELGTRSNRAWPRFAAGMLVVFVSSIKVFPAFIAVFYYLTKTKAVRVGLLVGALVALLSPMALFGWEVGARLSFDFVRHLGEFHKVYTLEETFNLSLASLIATWFKFLGQATVQIVTLALSLFIGGGFLWYAAKTKQSPEPRHATHVWAFAVALMALLNSGSRADYFIFYLPAFCSVAEYLLFRRAGAWFWSATLTAAAIFALLTEWVLQSRELNHRLEDMRIPVVGMLILCVLLVRVIRTREWSLGAGGRY